MGFWRFGSFCNIKSLFFKGLRVRHSAKLRGVFGKVTGGIRQSYGGGSFSAGAYFRRLWGLFLPLPVFGICPGKPPFFYRHFCRCQLPAICRRLPQVAVNCLRLPLPLARFRFARFAPASPGESPPAPCCRSFTASSCRPYPLRFFFRPVRPLFKLIFPGSSRVQLRLLFFGLLLRFLRFLCVCL